MIPRQHIPWWPGYDVLNPLLRDAAALYPIWEGAGSVVHNVLDPSFKTDGVLTNMTKAAWVSDGGHSAIEFDGTNDFIQTTLDPDTIGTNDGIGISSFSVSLWFRRTTAGTSDILFSWNGTITSNVVGLMTVATGITYANNRQVDTIETFTWSHDLLWHHLCVSNPVRANAVQLYLDGDLLSKTTDSGSPNPNDSNVVIGGRVQGSACWQGLIDDFVIFNEFLPADRVQQIYQAERGGLTQHKPRRARLVQPVAGGGLPAGSLALLGVGQ